MDVLSKGGFAPTPVPFPALPTSGTIAVTAQLPPCPCLVEDLTLQANPTLVNAGALEGALTVASIEVGQGAAWRPVPASILTGPDRWQTGGPDSGSVALRPGPAGLKWSFDVAATDPVPVQVRDRPEPLPAIAASSVTGGKTGAYVASGLDGHDLPVDIVAVKPNIPGAPADGVVVDRSYAELAAAGDAGGADQQVWISAGHAASIAGRLKAQGVTINSEDSTGALAKTLSRSGPGLAQVLFLTEAAAAAILAAGSSILSLYLFARRRRYELAALAVVGIKHRTLRASVVVEQMIVLSYGCLLGMGAGLVTALLVLRDTPEFQVPETGLSVLSFPPLPILAAVLTGTFLVTLAIGALAAASLIRGVTLGELREAPV